MCLPIHRDSSQPSLPLEALTGRSREEGLVNRSTKQRTKGQRWMRDDSLRRKMELFRERQHFGCCARKSAYALHPDPARSPQCCFRDSFNTGLVDRDPLPQNVHVAFNTKIKSRKLGCRNGQSTLKNMAGKI